MIHFYIFSDRDHIDTSEYILGCTKSSLYGCMRDDEDCGHEAVYLAWIPCDEDIVNRLRERIPFKEGIWFQISFPSLVDYIEKIFTNTRIGRTSDYFDVAPARYFMGKYITSEITVEDFLELHSDSAKKMSAILTSSYHCSDSRGFLILHSSVNHLEILRKSDDTVLQEVAVDRCNCEKPCSIDNIINNAAEYSLWSVINRYMKCDLECFLERAPEHCYCSKKLAKYLLGKGSSSEDGLRGAVKGGNLELAKFFYKKGAKNKREAIKIAVEKDHGAIIEWLFGVDPLVCIEVAIEENQYSTVEFYATFEPLTASQWEKLGNDAVETDRYEIANLCYTNGIAMIQKIKRSLV